MQLIYKVSYKVSKLDQLDITQDSQKGITMMKFPFLLCRRSNLSHFVTVAITFSLWTCHYSQAFAPKNISIRILLTIQTQTVRTECVVLTNYLNIYYMLSTIAGTMVECRKNEEGPQMYTVGCEQLLGHLTSLQPLEIPPRITSSSTCWLSFPSLWSRHKSSVKSYISSLTYTHQVGTKSWVQLELTVNDRGRELCISGVLYWTHGE